MMESACPALSPDGPFLSTLLLHVDCQAQAIGQGGYQALAAPNSAAALLLTGLLTIFVALFGYRMALGEVPHVRAIVMAAARIGAVLVLATGWQPFRTLAYDVALHGPAEVAAAIGRPADLPGAGGGLVPHLQAVDDALAELLVLGTGKPPGADVVVGATQPLTPLQQQRQMRMLEQLQQRPRWDPARDALLLGEARTLYLTGAIGAFAVVRLIAGLLLALGPLFVLFLLFDGTRGLFEGWVRGLAGAALGGVSTALVLGVELALVEPWLAAILAERRAGTPTPAVPIELLVVMLVFALALLAALIATARVAHGWRMPASRGAGTAGTRWAARERAPDAGRLADGGAPGAPADSRSRAHAIADGVAAAQRRETATLSRLAGGAPAAARAEGRPGDDGAPPPLGQRARRTRPRTSPAMMRRDGTA